MSKTFRPFSLVFAVLLLILHLFNNSNAQDLDVNIKLDASQPQIVTIEGKRKVISGGSTERNLSFLTSIAGIQVSGDRISNLKLFDPKGTTVSYKRFMPGEYVADAEFTGWAYQVDLTPPKDQKLMARVSWMTKNAGILMLDDLLPQFAKGDNIRSANVFFSISLSDSDSSSWPIYSSAKKTGKNTFFIPDIRSTNFLLGSGWGSWVWDQPIRGTKDPPAMYFLGEFGFDSLDASIIAIQIFQEYQKRFGSGPLSYRIAIVRFPNKMSPDTWEAGTRGSDITILTSDTSLTSQALQHLHEQLRHEIFHLWIPNGVNLNGHYDWFYEGFALYQSLKTGVALNRIRFDDYLDTLSRAYDLNRTWNSKISLIDASRSRWLGDNNTLIYARGMLVAFLCDLALLEKSEGKRSVTDLLRQLFEQHRPPNPEEDGNAAVLKLLRSNGELVPIIERNITGTESIEWTDLLKGAGFEEESNDKATRLKVTTKPSGKQRELLDKLGYNNWRKLASK